VIRLGYHPSTWGGGCPGLWAGIECMSANHWDGFEYCGDISEWYGYADEFRQKIEAYDMQLSSLYLGSGYEDAEAVSQFLERVADSAKFCAEVGSEFVLIDGGKRNDANEYSDADFQRVADAANKAGEICREAGVQCSWHQHWGTMFEFQENLDRLMEMTDPELVLCTPDTGQHSLGDFDVVSAVSKYADRIKYIHFKDLDRKRRFIELGRGTVDFWGTWQVLQKHNFDGWIVVDLDYTSLTPEESCRINKAYLNEILGIKGRRDNGRGRADLSADSLPAQPEESPVMAHP